MKKKIIIMVLASMMSMSLISCAKGVRSVKTTAATVKDTSKETTEVQNEYYKSGEFADIKTENGDYIFSVRSAKVLEAVEGRRDRVLQVEYEYENIDFKGVEFVEGVEVKDVVTIDQKALKVKDSNGYILQPMQSAWEGEWKIAQPAGFGEKCVAKYTFVLEEYQAIENVFVSFARLDKDFEIPVDGL